MVPAGIEPTGTERSIVLEIRDVDMKYEKEKGISGLVVKSNVAIVGPRVRFTAGAFIIAFSFGGNDDAFLPRYIEEHQPLTNIRNPPLPPIQPYYNPDTPSTAYNHPVLITAR